MRSVSSSAPSASSRTGIGGGRRLAAVPAPCPGEFLGSWVDRVAASLGASAGNTARWLGFACRLGPGGSTLRPRFYGVALTEASRIGLAASTGLAPSVFEGMCLSRFADTALDLSGLDLADERSLVTLAQREWMLLSSTRACPLCLAESGGVWRLWWRLGFAAACPRHGVLLVDTCPGCGFALRRGHPHRGATLLRRGRADPLRCGNSGPDVAHPGPAGGCPRRINDIETVPVSAELLAVQAAVLDVAFGGSCSLMGAPVSAREWIGGLRFVAAVHRMFAPVEYVAGSGGMPAIAAEAFADATRRRGSKRALRVRVPPSAAHAAADLLLAVPVLGAANPSAAAELLMPIACAEAAMLEASGNRQDRMWSVERPEALHQVWKVIRRSRHRGFDASVIRLPRSRPAAGLDYRHIPQLIDAEDYRELLGPVLPNLTERAGRRLTAAACARTLGARSWRQAARELELESRARMVARYATAIGQGRDVEARFWVAVAVVLDRLAARGPIDYAARRASLAGLVELPLPALAARCAGHRVGVSPRRCRYAAAWVWAQCTSGDMIDAPATTSVVLRGTARRLDSSARRRFIDDLAAPVTDRLRQLGHDLLAAQDIQ